MSMKLNAGDVTRNDNGFQIPLDQIIVDEKLNGRAYPHGDPEVASLANDYAVRGQLQPVQVRRVAENKVQLVLGFRRYKAALLYNTLHPDAPMKLKASVVIVNDEEALQNNIQENRERQEPTPIDDAVNQRKLREVYGWTDTRIADFYYCSPPYVGLLKKLLSLSEDIRLRVHDKLLSVEAALALADLPQDEQVKILGTTVPTTDPATPHVVNTPADVEVATDAAPTPPTNAEIIEQVRDAKIARGGKHPRSLAALRKYLSKLNDAENEESNAQLRTFSGVMLKFIQGYYVDKTMTEKLTKLLVNEEAEALSPVELPAEAAVAENPVANATEAA